jgi:uncharacterized phage protein (TIGR01671 family)
MKREIKFRAWDNIVKKMFIPSMINADGDVRHTWDGGETWLLKSTRSFVLMQFTGLIDKNGVDIYEGDIFELGGGDIVQIQFKHGGFGWISALDGESFIGFAGHNHFSLVIIHIKVIGNIYENPDRLKV